MVTLPSARRMDTPLTSGNITTDFIARNSRRLRGHLDAMTLRGGVRRPGDERVAETAHPISGTMDNHEVGAAMTGGDAARK